MTIGRMSQATIRPDHKLIPSKKLTARTRPGDACIVMYGSLPYGLMQKEYGSPRARASVGELFLECRVSELGIEIENLRPIRHHCLGEIALTVEHFLEERILRCVAVKHDVGRLDELRIELLRRVE